MAVKKKMLASMVDRYGEKEAKDVYTAVKKKQMKKKVKVLTPLGKTLKNA